jgi:hypothetical protein
VTHDSTPSQISDDMHAGVWLRSVYFFDPDGILLKIVAWTRVLGEGDAHVEPVD